MSNKIIIKTSNTAQPYENILNLSLKEIVNISDLEAISETISNYFKQNIIKQKNKFKLNINGLKTTITTNTHIGFGLKLGKFSGSSIADKLNKILDKEYLLKKLNENKSIYTEVYFFARSNFQYVTDICVRNNNKRIISCNKYFRTSSKLSCSGAIIGNTNLEKSIDAQNADFCDTVKELQLFAQKTSLSWLTATITSPPIFHINPENGANCWDGKSTPQNCNDFHNTIWSKTQKKLYNLGITAFGVWVKEVNKSSAIHRHLIIYASALQIFRIKKCIKEVTKKEYIQLNCQYSAKASKFDSGNPEDRTQITKITNYVAKTFKSERYSKLDKLTKDKILAHSHKYKYRRFGFFGLKNKLSIIKLLKQFDCLANIPTTPVQIKELVLAAKNNAIHQFLLIYAQNTCSVLLEKISILKQKFLNMANRHLVQSLVPNNELSLNNG